MEPSSGWWRSPASSWLTPPCPRQRPFGHIVHLAALLLPPDSSFCAHALQCAHPVLPRHHDRVRPESLDAGGQHEHGIASV
eukprot:scaffold7734_cov592-Prasinococcus_capsulatus_cf.AAC.3